MTLINHRLKKTTFLTVSSSKNCHISVCSKISRLCFCQILFELVYSWEIYYKNKKSKLLIETQCSFVAPTTFGAECRLPLTFSPKLPHPAVRFVCNSSPTCCYNITGWVKNLTVLLKFVLMYLCQRKGSYIIYSTSTKNNVSRATTFKYSVHKSDNNNNFCYHFY